MQDNYPAFHIGINIFVIKDGLLLLGKRINAHGAGTWGLPGGHLEIGERMVAAAARELTEETGLRAKDFEFSNIINDGGGGKNYVQIGFIAQGVTSKPMVKEPDRCEVWKWFEIDNLPKEIYPAHIKQIENFIKKSYLFDA